MRVHHIHINKTIPRDRDDLEIAQLQARSDSKNERNIKGQTSTKRANKHLILTV